MRGEGTLRRALARQAGSRPGRRRWYAALARDPRALGGGAVLLAMAVAAVLAPRLAPFDPPAANDPLYFTARGAEPHAPPVWDRGEGPPPSDDPFAAFDRPTPYDPRFVLGTDWERRDMLSLLLYGTRYSLAVGLLAVALVALLGTALGLAAGWRGGSLDDLVTRAADLAEAVPALLAYVLLASVAAGPLGNLLGVAGLYLDAVPVVSLLLASVGWVPVARLVRGRVRGLRETEWVLAARATGVPTRRLLLRHVLPHTAGAVLVAASAQLPVMLLADGLLGAVGVGRRPPSDTLGELIFHEFAFTVRLPVYVLMPTVLVIAMSLAVAALSDGMRRALDPRRLG